MPDETQHNAITQVCEFVRSQELFANLSRVLVAVSGGADSIALLSLLDHLIRSGAYDLELVCVHLDHQLRGTTAAQVDHTHVSGLAQRLGWPCISDKLRVRDHAHTQKLSIETAARELRRAKLQALSQQHDCQAIATGHHLDDNAETLIFRLQRGTGIAGLAGIRPRSKIQTGLHLIRPLLCLTRQEIQSYLQSQSLTWIEDPSNRDITFRRNYLRHALLPDLQRSSTQPLNYLLNELAQSACTLQHRLEAVVENHWDQWTTIDNQGFQLARSLFEQQPPWVQIVTLQKALTVIGCGLRNIDRQHLHQLQRLGSTGSGQHVLPQGLTATGNERGLLLSWPSKRVIASAPTTTLTVPGTTHWGSVTLSAAHVDSASCITDDCCLECLDADRLVGSLQIRARKPGDHFQALGASGSRKVGKFLTDAKIPTVNREQVVIIEDQEKIVWLAPVRLSERVKVTSKTRRVLQLKLELLQETQVVLEE